MFLPRNLAKHEILRSFENEKFGSRMQMTNAVVIACLYTVYVVVRSSVCQGDLVVSFVVVPCRCFVCLLPAMDWAFFFSQTVASGLALDFVYRWMMLFCFCALSLSGFQGDEKKYWYPFVYCCKMFVLEVVKLFSFCALRFRIRIIALASFYCLLYYRI